MAKKIIRTSAIVAAGGVGKRLKAACHKPFVKLKGRPMLRWTLDALSAVPEVDELVVVAHPEDIPHVRRMVQAGKLSKVSQVVIGGKTRTDSVFNGLQAIAPTSKWVLVHDAARPLIEPAVVSKALRKVKRVKAAVVAVPVVPTIKQVNGVRIEKTLDRKTLWAIQTPQLFERTLFEDANAYAQRKKLPATDDASLVEAFGHPVEVVEGSHKNIKVTTPEDILVAETFLKRKA